MLKNTFKVFVVAIVASACFLFCFSGFYGEKKKVESPGKGERKENERGEAMGALQFLNTSRAFPNKDIPADAYGKAANFYNSNYRNQTARTNGTQTVHPWQSIGPNNLGGRTLSIAFDPADTSIIWLGSASGGLWKSTTGGIGQN